ncbi:MAG: cell division protein FtsZ [Lentimonas sp.]|jgi:cell division protein FtsZ
MTLKINIPQLDSLKPKISIFGVGGAGSNALNNMISSNLEGVEFIAANTDSQSLANSLAANRIQLGLTTTKGLGAGSFPDRGREAAEENMDEINGFLEGSHMVFITAGMGGGTGTGAAPVIAKLARDREILTVGVVTKPFHFEGKYRMETALQGIEDLKKCVDTLIVIPNQNLFRIANEHTTFEEAFKMADNVLHAGVRGVTDLITMPGLVNLDFADIRTIMTKMGKALMGTGEASGENRAVIACEEAISNPLLDDISIRGAKGVLVNMTGGPDMTLFEADQAVNAIRKEVDENANIIFGSAFNENMQGSIRVSVVATGIGEDDCVDIDSKNEEIIDDSANEFTVKEESINYFDAENIQNNHQAIQPITEESFVSQNVEELRNQEFSQEEIDQNIIPKVQETIVKPVIQEGEKLVKPKVENPIFENTEDVFKEEVDIFAFADSREDEESQNSRISSNLGLEDDFPEGNEARKENAHKKSKKKGGFGLFGFMNNLSRGGNNSSKDNVDKAPKATFHDDNNIVSVDKSFQDEDDDAVLNVPAFFRRKK